MAQDNLEEHNIQTLSGGECIVKAGFHFIIGKAENATIRVQKGGKLSIRLSLNCKIEAEDGAEVKTS